MPYDEGGGKTEAPAPERLRYVFVNVDKNKKEGIMFTPNKTQINLMNYQDKLVLPKFRRRAVPCPEYLKIFLPIDSTLKKRFLDGEWKTS